MKRILRAILGPFWRLSRPARGAFGRRFEAAVARATSTQVAGLYAHADAARAEVAALERPDGPFQGVIREVFIARMHASEQAAEANLLMDSLVRELARLQRQVESLQESVDELSAARDGRIDLVRAKVG